MQHDTSPHQVLMGGQEGQGPVCGVGPRLLQKALYPVLPLPSPASRPGSFSIEAFRFMDGTCPRCIIDNTSVIVAHGSGPDAEIAPEMERFGQIFGVTFIPHAVGDADRKAKMERNFCLCRT